MKTNLLRMISATFACLGLSLVGCSGGGGNGGGGGGTTYKVGGTLTGLGAGQRVILQDNGGDTLTLSANGSFSFPTSLNRGSGYSVTVHSHTPGIACAVSNGSGSVGSSDVTGVGVSCAAGAEKILYSFGASTTDGYYPAAGVIMDNAGNLYGTTEYGGANSGAGQNGAGPTTYGTIFKIDTTGKESILHSFGANSTDGQNPFGGLIMDSAGNLYGTTLYGGANVQATGVSDGTVFKISGSGMESVLYSFGANPSDGLSPMTGLIMDSTGNLYGTTYGGGANGEGTVFKISASGVESVLYSFGASTTDGRLPFGSLIMDSAENLYGTTYSGGTIGNGTVFKISASGTETILHSFGAPPDGGNPTAGLIMDGAGNLWGTTVNGGANYAGTVFEISPATGGTFTEAIFYSLRAVANDGENPHASLIMDNFGNFYGTTYLGGVMNAGTVLNGGTVFMVDPAGAETILYSFGAGANDGQSPNGGLIVDSAGNVYGTTYYGGANGYDNGGTVFKID